MLLFLIGFVVGFFAGILVVGLMRAAQEYDTEGDT